MDEDALKAFHNGDVQNAVDMLTIYSVAAGNEQQKIWTVFFCTFSFVLGIYNYGGRQN